MDRVKAAGVTVSEQAMRDGESLYLVEGQTYPHRALLRDLGGRWDAARGVWLLPGRDAAERLRAALEREAGQAPARPHYHGHRQRLRERFMEQPGALPDYELLELLLFYAIPRRDVKPLAKALLARFDSLAGVLAAVPERLSEVPGVNHQVIVNFKAMRELARRLARLAVAEKPRLGAAKDVLSYCHVAMAHEPVEQLRLLFLDAKLRLIADEVQQSGTVDHTPAYPREIVKRALELDASGLILVHNHPSGDPEPSRADIDMTEEIQRALEAVGLKLHDHFVVARKGHVSIRDLGYL